MVKNVVILSDGTGQGASMPKAERTNVWKLWDATKAAAPPQQVTFYDEGLGAEHKREWWRWAYDLASQATGLGISQNIKDCYTALIEHYEPGDRVFLFGFSRGAFTVRSLGGVLSLCGIPQRDAAGNSPRDRQNKKGRLALVEEAVEKVYKHYGDKEKEKERIALGAQFRERYQSLPVDGSDPPFPYFIGVWDTVRALGIPGSSGVVLWRHAFHNATLNACVPYARHALSIDENREIFAPEIWDEFGRITGGQGARSHQAGLVPRRAFRRRRWISRDRPVRSGVGLDDQGGNDRPASADRGYEQAEVEAVARRHPARRADGMGPNLDRRHQGRRSGRQGAGCPARRLRPQTVRPGHGTMRDRRSPLSSKGACKAQGLFDPLLMRRCAGRRGGDCGLTGATPGRIICSRGRTRAHRSDLMQECAQ